MREVADRGGDFRKLGSDFDQSLSVGFWSEDSKTIYFNAGVKVTTQLHALDIERDRVSQVTEERAALSVNRDDDTGVQTEQSIQAGFSGAGEFLDPPFKLFFPESLARAKDEHVCTEFPRLRDSLRHESR